MKDIARVHLRGVIEEFRNIDKELDPKYTLKWFEDVWNQQTCKIKVHEENGKVVGFYTVIEGEVMLYVDPDYHRQGIGSKLLGDDDSLWVIEGNFPAERFYHRHGFRRTWDERTVTIFGNKIKEVLWKRGK